MLKATACKLESKFNLTANLTVPNGKKYGAATLLPSFNLTCSLKGSSVKLNLEALNLDLISNSTYTIDVNPNFIIETENYWFGNELQTISYTTPPLELISISPKEASGDKIKMCFNYKIKESSSGDIKLYESGNPATLITQYNTSTGGGNYGPKPIIDGYCLTLNTSGRLSENKSYYLLSDAGSVKDLGNNNSLSVSDPSQFTFATSDLTFNGLKSNMQLSTSIYAKPTSDFVMTVRVSNNQTVYFYITGSSNMVVKWGDGTQNTYAGNGTNPTSLWQQALQSAPSQAYNNLINQWTGTTIAHTYTDMGDYQINISGTVQIVNLSITTGEFAISIDNFNDGLLIFESLDQNYLTSVPDEIPNTLKYIGFSGSDQLNDPKISSWNVSNIVNMSNMFNGCYTFNQPLNNWDTGNVITMHSMFYQATSFNQPLNNWDTGNVGNPSYSGYASKMDNMFYQASSFDQNIRSWNVQYVPTKPGGFDYGTSTNWITIEKPLWGTSGS